jgi:catechol 2,3-dioxygenase-like lactoylglutathione lyase family enzyme
MTSLKTKVSTPLWRECVAFYSGIFGMVVAEQWEEHDDQGAILAFSNGRGEAYLELYQADRAYDVSGISLQFRVPDLQSFLQSLPIGLEYEGPSLRPWGSTYVYLRDPAGVLVIVYEGGL